MTRVRFQTWTLLVGALALMVALAGCGGDDNGLSAEDMARISTAEADAATARSEAAAAAAAQATAEAEAMAAAAAQAEAEAEAAAAMAARMTAEAATAAAKAAQTMAEEDQKDAEDARDAAIAAQGVAETARDAANAARAIAEAARKDAEDALAAANMEIEELKEAAMVPTADEVAAMTAAGRAAALRIMNAVGPMPIQMETADIDEDTGAANNSANDPSDDATFPADTIQSGEGVRMGIEGGVSITGLSQSRLGQDAMLALAVEGGSGLSTDDDSAEMDAPEIDGFIGVSLMKDGPGAITQTALVYSDAERSVRAFGDVYRYTHMVNGTAGTNEATRTHILVGNAVQANADGKVMLVHGLSTTTGVIMRDIDNGGTVRGYYDGVAGLYTFNDSAGSMITLRSDGSITITSTTLLLTFRADNHETLLPDTDYLAFGVWKEAPDDPTNANPGRTRPFVHGNAGAYSYGDVKGLDGMASYSGGAVGHWATRAARERAVEMGRFTADASLTANFDGGLGDAVVLSGMINGFMDEAGEMDMAGWLVNLNDGRMLTMTFDQGTANDITDDVAVARPSTDSDIYGMTDGTTGSLSWEGVWDAWLFGVNKSNYPTGVAGRFQAEAGDPNPADINAFTDDGFAGVVGSFAGR